MCDWLNFGLHGPQIDILDIQDFVCGKINNVVILAHIGSLACAPLHICRNWSMYKDFLTASRHSEINHGKIWGTNTNGLQHHPQTGKNVQQTTIIALDKKDVPGESKTADNGNYDNHL